MKKLVNVPSVNGGPEQAMIPRWNGTAWSVDSSSAFGGSPAAGATFPGAANERAVGFGSGDQGLVVSDG
jgi:hypothetical protein